MDANTLYYGDNLDILRRYVDDESVDLIYLDPPFNSKQAYNVIFEEPNGSGSGAQIQAFEDTWHWDPPTAELFEQVVETGTKRQLGSVAVGACTNAKRSLPPCEARERRRLVPWAGGSAPEAELVSHGSP